MSYRIDKPMLSPHQLIIKMRDSKGITFKYVSESDAEEYLTDVNNYLRVAAFRKNYQKHTKGPNKGKYIDLDFAYLQELSVIDMHLRFLVSKMCSDIEHAIKVHLVRDIGNDSNEDGYTIVKRFFEQEPYIINKLNGVITSPFTGDLLKKYFSVQQNFNDEKRKIEKQIVAYDDCPVWVLCELLSFGDIISFYDFYYTTSSTTCFSRSVFNLVRSLRNAAAHNTCILANLNHGSSKPPKEIDFAVRPISSISKSQAQKKLSCRPMLELVALFYMYNNVVTERIKRHRLEELRQLFFVRMPENKDFFKKNELILSNYQFICNVINDFFT